MGTPMPSPEELQTQPENCPVWTLSPVSDLSSSLRKLHCQGSATPRRRLRLSPELLTPSPAADSRVSEEMTTPTDSITLEGGRRSQNRCKSPKCTHSKMKKLSERVKIKNEESDHQANKENKRFRVKLSSLFASPTDPHDEAGWSRSPQAEESCGQQQTELPAHPSLHPLQRLKTRRQVPLLDIPESAIDNRSLIGDFSKTHLFPVEKGEHQDLQYISGQTVASLLTGEYSRQVEDYLIVDCRYPYEYQGGHIKGAVNLYCEAQLQAALLQDCVQSRLSPRVALPDSPPGTAHLPDSGPQTPSASPGSRSPAAAMQEIPTVRSPPSDSPSSRKVLVFHCEFSSERGPRLCRYLRKIDRTLNVYPQLFYPELYILDGGYKEFYSKFQNLCEPRGYVKMLHEDFSDQMRRFRPKRRSRPRQFGKKRDLMDSN
ncbi:cell division cycle 25 homolog d isoform X2 [Amia ocellicauda]|uniref:cell division cycle 25 homolog d isoform X2 n=1 Tax=Amia ocellicauda TaxID=2972642 RepID=UPI0034641A8F